MTRIRIPQAQAQAMLYDAITGPHPVDALFMVAMGAPKLIISVDGSRVPLTIKLANDGIWEASYDIPPLGEEQPTITPPSSGEV